MTEIEKQYNELKSKFETTGKTLDKYVSEYKFQNGLVPDHIWLKDPECLRLKHDCRMAEYNFKTFIRIYKNEVKQIQKQQHIQRRNERLTNIN